MSARSWRVGCCGRSLAGGGVSATPIAAYAEAILPAVEIFVGAAEGPRRPELRCDGAPRPLQGLVEWSTGLGRWWFDADQEAVRADAAETARARGLARSR